MTQPCTKIEIVRERPDRWFITWIKEGTTTAHHRVNEDEALIMLCASLQQMEPLLDAETQRP